MRNLFAAIAIAGAVALPAWGQVWRLTEEEATVYPRATTRSPTAEESASVRTREVRNQKSHPTLGERVFQGEDSFPGESTLRAERLQAFLGDRFEVTALRSESSWLIYARPKEGAPAVQLDTNIWAQVDDVNRRTDAVGDRARYYEANREVDFRGGTLEQFLSMLLPNQLQLDVVYLPAEIRSARIAPIRIKSVGPWQAIRLVERLYSKDFSIGFIGFPKGRDDPHATTLTVSASPEVLARQLASTEPSVVRLPPASATSDSARREQEHLQDEILRAIADGIALRGGPSSNFKLKLNPSTGILFVLGTAEEHELVRGVARAMMPEGARANDAEAVSNLPSPPPAPRTADAPSAPPAAPPAESDAASPPKRPKPPAPTP